MSTLSDPPPGRRELRKRKTRKALLGAAEELFGQRGYDEVTVAEIAAAAGVSVKTLFQHFRSKEDLVFGDADTTRDQILDAIQSRATGVSPLDAITEWLRIEARRDPHPDGLEAYHRTIGSSPAIASRLRRLWDDYETAVARALADENNEATPTPRTRLVAAVLIAMIRVVTSTEVREFVARHPSGDSAAALEDWIEQARRLLGQGLDRASATRASSQR